MEDGSEGKIVKYTDSLLSLRPNGSHIVYCERLCIGFATWHVFKLKSDKKLHELSIF